jgi:Endonuclease/Exonuclease/phosphatase family
LVRLNNDLLGGVYRHVTLVDGNDDRGIDVGIPTKDGFAIRSIRSNVDAVDDDGTIFNRDCPRYEIHTPGGTVLHVLINHFKSQSGGGTGKRRRQAREVRRIADGLVAAGQHVIVLGDLNEGQPADSGGQLCAATSVEWYWLRYDNHISGWALTVRATVAVLVVTE